MTDKNKTKKILLFTLEYPPFKGGVANVYYNIVRHWPEGEIIVLADKHVNTQKDNIGNNKVIFKSLLRPYWLASFFYLWQAVRRHQIDTIVVGNILPLGTVTCWLAKLIRVKYVVCLHGMDLACALKVKRKKIITKRILSKADKIICFNSYVANILKNNFSHHIYNKTTVINPGIVASVTPTKELVHKLRAQYELQGKIVLLQVGRLVERKGVDKVLDALPQVVLSCPELVYIIIGNGPEYHNYKMYTNQLHLDKNVHILTNVSDQVKNAWYEICDIFIMPARGKKDDFEGFGIVYLEANTHGKAVIAGDSGGIRDAVRDNWNGLLVDPNSTDDIKDAIIKLCKNESLRHKLGKQGREWATNFNWSKQVRLIQKILNT